jgi:hypothetical protein
MSSTLDGGARGLSAPLGSVEPHAGLLTTPAAEQRLYKIVSVENLLRSIVGSYLHFNRVDSYADFPSADAHDGQQPPADQSGNANAHFLKAPEYSAAEYYDNCRSRTYACCFSIENSDFIWRNYANGSRQGKVCVVFQFGKLRATLNQTFKPGNAALLYNGVDCQQIFSINYGVVKYVDWDRHKANEEHLPNPISYTYLKSNKYHEENELRVSLSALGIGHFRLNDGSFLDFPSSLSVPFDFRDAIAAGVISQILSTPETDGDFLSPELYKLRIAPK